MFAYQVFEFCAADQALSSEQAQKLFDRVSRHPAIRFIGNGTLQLGAIALRVNPATEQMELLVLHSTEQMSFAFGRVSAVGKVSSEISLRPDSSSGFKVISLSI